MPSAVVGFAGFQAQEVQCAAHGGDQAWFMCRGVLFLSQCVIRVGLDVLWVEVYKVREFLGYGFRIMYSSCALFSVPFSFLSDSFVKSWVSELPKDDVRGFV